jgi:hypothetical protein
MLQFKIKNLHMWPLQFCHENCDHENSFHETLIFHINKFDTMNWIIMNQACTNGIIPLLDLHVANFRFSYVTMKCKTYNYEKIARNH